jgi:MSHA biogenesis protein MshL
MILSIFLRWINAVVHRISPAPPPSVPSPEGEGRVRGWLPTTVCEFRDSRALDHARRLPWLAGLGLLAVPSLWGGSLEFSTWPPADAAAGVPSAWRPRPAESVSPARTASAPAAEAQVASSPKWTDPPALVDRAAPVQLASVSPALNPGQLISQELKERKLYSFRAENLDLKAALAIFARANHLNIVPDPEVTGQVTLDLADLPLARVLQALLEAHDYSWSEEDGLVRVHATATQIFSVDYLRLSRTGVGASAATISSSSSGTSGGLSGNMAAGPNGLAANGPAGGGLMSGTGAGMNGSMINLTQANPVDFWKELELELDKILTPAGKTTMAINRTAGLIQITDRPSALKKVERYLAGLDTSIQRQVEIEAKLYDVTLNNQFQLGLDWQHIVDMYGGQMSLIGTPTVVSPAGAAQLKQTALALAFNNKNTSVILTALKEQGDVSVISQPRLRTLNNQTAMIKVGTDTPFFSQNTFFLPSSTVGGTATPVTQDQYQLITIGTIVSITPQISTNGYITMDISPVITSLVDTKVGPNKTTAPVIDIKQTSTIVRVASNNTVVIGGLVQNSHSKTLRRIPIVGDIPLLGLAFQGRFDSKQKKELVILLTPTIIP